ncbi:NAD(P)-binding protein [Streptomyces roseolus]|uniref:NAD(P)-binding protein n=1 Tax=Streptomyces roseolus TaxID=67358 RepID=UPI00364E5614
MTDTCMSMHRGVVDPRPGRGPDGRMPAAFRLTEGTRMTETPSTAPVVDLVCVGAGFSGLYAAYKAAEKGWTFAGFEAAPDVGGDA